MEADKKSKFLKSPRNRELTANKIDLVRILEGKCKNTTVMIRHIPNHVSSKDLTIFISKKCGYVFDLLYLPIDFNSSANLGYGFVNFTHPWHILKFHFEFNGKEWEVFKSSKVVD